jgi:hypothetical protein
VWGNVEGAIVTSLSPRVVFGGASHETTATPPTTTEFPPDPAVISPTSGTPLAPMSPRGAQKQAGGNQGIGMPETHNAKAASLSKFSVDCWVTPLFGASPKHDGRPVERFRSPIPPAVWPDPSICLFTGRTHADYSSQAPSRLPLFRLPCEKRSAGTRPYHSADTERARTRNRL